MKHLSIKVFGKEAFEYNANSEVVDLTDDKTEERLDSLNRRIGAFEHGLEKMLSMLQDFDGSLRLLEQKTGDGGVALEDALGTRLQDVPAPVKREVLWEGLSLSASRKIMGTLYDEIARQFMKGDKDAVLIAGSDYDPSKPFSKVADAIKAGMDKRGYKVRVQTNGVNEILVMR